MFLKDLPSEMLLRIIRYTGKSKGKFAQAAEWTKKLVYDEQIWKEELRKDFNTTNLAENSGVSARQFYIWIMNIEDKIKELKKDLWEDLNLYKLLNNLQVSSDTQSELLNQIASIHLENGDTSLGDEEDNDKILKSLVVEAEKLQNEYMRIYQEVEKTILSSKIQDLFPESKTEYIIRQLSRRPMNYFNFKEKIKTLIDVYLDIYAEGTTNIEAGFQLLNFLDELNSFDHPSNGGCRIPLDLTQIDIEQIGNDLITKKYRVQEAASFLVNLLDNTDLLGGNGNYEKFLKLNLLASNKYDEKTFASSLQEIHTLVAEIYAREIKDIRNFLIERKHNIPLEDNIVKTLIIEKQRFDYIKSGGPQIYCSKNYNPDDTENDFSDEAFSNSEDESEQDNRLFETFRN